jgi:hypothetical protein
MLIGGTYQHLHHTGSWRVRRSIVLHHRPGQVQPTAHTGSCSEAAPYQSILTFTSRVKQTICLLGLSQRLPSGFGERGSQQHSRGSMTPAALPLGASCDPPWPQSGPPPAILLLALIWPPACSSPPPAPPLPPSHASRESTGPLGSRDGGRGREGWGPRTGCRILSWNWNLAGGVVHHLVQAENVASVPIVRWHCTKIHLASGVDRGDATALL